MKQNPKRRLLAAASAGLIAVSVLAGCVAKTDSINGQKESGQTGKEREQTAKGRYIEKEISLPEEVKGKNLAGCIQAADKSLEFYFTDENNSVSKYCYNGETWQEEEFGVPLLQEEGIRLTKVIAGYDGNNYYGGFDQNYRFHMWKDSGSDKGETVFDSVFSVPEGEAYGVIPDYLAVLENGTLLLSQVDDAGIYSLDGKQVFILPQEYIGMDQRISACAGADSYLTLLDNQIVRYDTGSGKQADSYEIPEKLPANKYDMTLFETENGLYAASKSGLYRTGKDGTVWEQIIDGSLNSMGRQDIFLNKFFEGGTQDYYGIYSKMSEIFLFHYVFDETVDTVPAETVSVYALKDNPTVRQAAAILQKNNSDIKVDLRIALGEDEEATEDVIRALNTELLNGKGADVLILDGLPAEAYQEKGILADIGYLLASSDVGLLPNIKEDFTAKDGKIYYMPVRIVLPVTLGEEKAVKALQSLELMKNYEETPPLLAPDVYENVLRMTAYTCYGELFEAGGKLKTETLPLYLEAVKSAGERSTVENNFTEEQMGLFNINNMVSDFGFGRQSEYNFVLEKCPVGADIVECLDTSLLLFSAAKLKSAPIESIHNSYIPFTMAGINASTENKAAAEEFIKTLFGEEVQKESLYDGFPVKKDAIRQWVEIEKDTMVSMSTYGSDFSLEGSWPDKSQREHLLSLVETADTALLIDPFIMEMIIKGSWNYLEGKETLEEAVQSIENQVRLYTAEKE